jgi:hemerythrin
MITWHEMYSTGHPELDAEHKQLIDQLNQLETALKEGAARDQIPRLLKFLADYAVKHFQHEESCMAQYRCPSALENKKAHAAFISKFSKIQKEIQTNPKISTTQILDTHRELCDWIRSHMLKIDCQLKACIKK